MIKTLFLGSNYEALETLKALHESPKFHIVGVVTQPDKPVGRGREIQETQVKTYCIKNNLNVIHTNSNSEKYRETIVNLQPEIIVCKSFGEIIPTFALNYPKYGSINVHFSLLPKYRGAVPIQKAILEGQEYTGITIMLMSEKLDSGHILAQLKEKISKSDTNESLRKRLIEKTPEFLLNTLENWINRKIEPVKQDENNATYCFKNEINKGKNQILWKDFTAEYIDRMVRALIPWPIAWTIINDKRVRIFEVELRDDIDIKTGEFKTENNVFLVGTQKGTIQINSLQVEGKKVMTAQEFLNGTQVVSIQ